MDGFFYPGAASNPGETISTELLPAEKSHFVSRPDIFEFRV